MKKVELFLTGYVTTLSGVVVGLLGAWVIFAMGVG